MDVEIIKFNSEDGLYLNGFLKYNKQKKKKVILLIHGMAGNCFNKREKEISEQAIKNDIDSFSFNNRGSDVIKYLEWLKAKSNEYVMGGSACENFYDSYYDIKAAVKLMVELGYEEIYLCGHSLGATKIIYSYQKFLENNEEFLKKIKAVILLSLVDINSLFRICAGNNFEYYIDYAKKKMNEKKDLELMPRECFLYPVSVRSFLIYSLNNEKIDIVRFNQDDYEYKELNAIKKPLFMRWGTENELIEQEPDKLLDIIKTKIKNDVLDAKFIHGADHCYRKKEKQLANEIIQFLCTNV